MTISPEEDRALARQARVVSIVIAVAMILWLGGQWLGGKLGLEARYVFLLDFAAIGALLWALIVGINIWRKRRG
jgi:hypothetical protein